MTAAHAWQRIVAPGKPSILPKMADRVIPGPTVRAEHRRHASCVQLATGPTVLILGPPGSGKSTLCLMLIERFSAALVADDQVLLAETYDAQLIPRCPDAIIGQLEVRGVGIVPYPVLTTVRPLGLVIDLSASASMPRMPVPSSWTCGLARLPCFRLGPLNDQTADRVLAAYRLTLRGKTDHSDAVDANAADGWRPEGCRSDIF